MAYLCRQDFHCLRNRADLLCCRGPGDGFLSSATLFAQGACTSRSLPTITKSEFSNLIISSSFCQIQVELSNLRLLPPRPSLDPPRRRQHSAGAVRSEQISPAIASLRGVERGARRKQGIGPWTSHQAFLALCRANNLGTGEHDVRPTQDPIMSVMFVNSHEAVSSVC
jgi:hypothetical protein